MFALPSTSAAAAVPAPRSSANRDLLLGAAQRTLGTMLTVGGVGVAVIGSVVTAFSIYVLAFFNVTAFLPVAISVGAGFGILGGLLVVRGVSLCLFRDIPAWALAVPVVTGVGAAAIGAFLLCL